MNDNCLNNYVVGLTVLGFWFLEASTINSLCLLKAVLTNLTYSRKNQNLHVAIYFKILLQNCFNYYLGLTQVHTRDIMTNLFNKRSASFSLRWYAYVIIGHLIGCWKKLKIMQKFMEISCGKMCWLCRKRAWLCRNLNNKWSNVGLLGFSAAFQCAGCNVNTMNTSISPRSLALYSQNKHHFCQAVHIKIKFWSFSAIRWQA